MKKVVIYPIIFSLMYFLFSYGNNENKEKPGTYETLEQGFINPPSKAQPKVYWWWMNG